MVYNIYIKSFCEYQKAQLLDLNVLRYSNFVVSSNAMCKLVCCVLYFAADGATVFLEGPFNPFNKLTNKQ